MIRIFVVCLALIGLAACATPLMQTAGAPGDGFSGPRLEDSRFVSFDGAPLGLQHWDAEGREPWAVVIGLHGMNDYSNAFRLPGEAWARRGITTYAIDQRGFGRSPRRGVWADPGLMVEDLRTLTRLVRTRHPDAVIAIAGVSMGGAVAIEAFASERPPDADRLILLAPAVWGWSSQPLPNKLAAWIAGRTFPGWVIEPPRFITDDIMPSDNIDELRRMSRDRLMIWGARPDAVVGLIDLMEAAWSDTGRIRAPVAYLYGYEDDIIPKEPSFEAAARLKPTDKTAYYRDGHHLLLIDRQRERVLGDIEGFIRDPTRPLASGVVPLPVQVAGNTTQNAGSSRTRTLSPTAGASAKAARQ